MSIFTPQPACNCNAPDCVFCKQRNRIYWTAPGIDSKLTPASLLQRISYVSGISEQDIKGKCRKREITDARHFFFYKALEIFPDMTKKSIGGILGKDHASVIHAKKNINNLKELRDSKILGWIKKIENI